ncbi:MAG: S8 family serine peptidase [Bacteroidetes bacterium]|nr:S8 family serine peptidase [Bacteroidota bacterium]
MKKYYFTLFICLFIVQAKAQETAFYYTFNNQKINLTKITGKYLVEFPMGLFNNNNIPSGQKLNDKTFIVAQTDGLENYGLNARVYPNYLTDDGKEIYYPSEIILHFKEGVGEAAKSNLLTTNNLEYLKSSLSFSILKTNADPLEISKKIYESGFVDYCTPNFFVRMDKTALSDPPNDEYYSQQWYLNNTGQGSNDGHSTTVDADIDAPEAWDISKGDPHVVVAVIDEGVTSNHPDLPNTRQIRLNGSNFAAAFDGTNNPDDPSPTVSTTTGYNHGNACAGIIAATQNNGIGITGIAPLCRIMPVKIPLGINGPQASDFAGAIDFAVANGADILSNSWGIPTTLTNVQPAVVFAIQNAVNNNKVVVFSAGNTANRVIGERGSWGFLGFPANSNVTGMINVGASDRNNLVANYSPSGASEYNDVTTGLKLNMVAPSSTAINAHIPGEASNIWTIDIPGADYGYNSWREAVTSPLPAIGELLPNSGTNFTDYTGRMGGTSASAPQVAAVAALIKSVNPCLNAQQIRSILFQSADKVGPYNYEVDPLNPGISKQMGYGKLNAYQALLLAQQYNSSSVDLVIKDSPTDSGIEPNTITPFMWNSQDIWVRNHQDNGYIHENPLYDANAQNYIYVRIKNNSCISSTGNEILRVYWAKASTSLQWPYNWNGEYTEIDPIDGTTVNMGLQIGDGISIPSLDPGEEIILNIPWNDIPNPERYTWINPEPWHFCLLARIEAESDPFYSTETSDLNSNVRNNNNIAWKNVTVVYPEPAPVTTSDEKPKIGGVIAVGNPYNEPHTFFLEMVKEDLETGKPIYDEAEVSIKMDDKLYHAWERGGKQNQQLDPTLDEKKKIVTGNHVLLNNISFNAHEQGTLNLTFNFLTKEITDKTHFKYHVIQKDAVTGSVIGGETYEIKKRIRPLFTANAGGDKDVDRNETVVISAEQINEAAIYNWYDIDGNLIFQGKDLTVSADITRKYKLEVIALADGYKDYTEVLVKLKDNSLNEISPNPASDNITVNYKLNEVGSAYLMLIGSYGNTSISNNYILDVNSTQTNINISNYPTGFYIIALVCNGHIVDAKTVIKE